LYPVRLVPPTFWKQENRRNIEMAKSN